VRFDIDPRAQLPCRPLEIISFEEIDLVFDSRQDLDAWRREESETPVIQMVPRK